MLEVPSLVEDSEQTIFPVIQGELSKLEYSEAGRKPSSQPRGASTLYHFERAKYGNNDFTDLGGKPKDFKQKGT